MSWCVLTLTNWCSMLSVQPLSGRWGCFCLNLMQAAVGWCSCAVGAPAGQFAASASSVLSSEKDRKKRLVLPQFIPPVSSSSEYSLRPLQVSSAHWFIYLRRLTECTPNTPLYLTVPIYLLTNAADYNLLIMKPGRHKFQRSSKAHES